MSYPSLIFWAIFVVPLVAFLIWLMRQDKKKGVTGLVVLGILVVAAIAYTIWKKDGAGL
jgi:K+ transporter